MQTDTQKTPDDKLVFFHDIERHEGTARVRIMSCRLSAEGKTRNHRTHADYETLSKGATQSARRETKRVRNALADALTEIAGKLTD